MTNVLVYLLVVYEDRTSEPVIEVKADFEKMEKDEDYRQDIYEKINNKYRSEKKGILDIDVLGFERKEAHRVPGNLSK